MIVVIGDKHYPGVQPEDLSLLNIMVLEQELTLWPVSRCKTFKDVMELWAEVTNIKDKVAAENHPEMRFLTGLMVWMARVSAGERIGFIDAIDVPIMKDGKKHLQFIDEPRDRLPGKAKAPAKKRPSPKGSARGA